MKMKIQRERVRLPRGNGIGKEKIKRGGRQRKKCGYHERVRISNDFEKKDMKSKKGGERKQKERLLLFPVSFLSFFLSAERNTNLERKRKLAKQNSRVEGVN